MEWSGKSLVIENDEIQIEVLRHGAELSKLFHKKRGKNYLWSRNPAYWAKSSPVLFPIVGTLKDGMLMYKSHRYELPRHGFARDREFDMFEHQAYQVTFVLRDDEESRSLYPFRFTLKITYTLAGAKLKVAYQVSNPGVSEPLLFSLGAHPAFALPETAGFEFADYSLLFKEKEQSLQRYFLTKDGLLESKATQVDMKDSLLPLEKTMFEKDAWVIKRLNSRSIDLLRRDGQTVWRFEWENFPDFGIWSAPGADFICLEPWQGHADFVYHNQLLQEKPGMISLNTGESWNASWSISFTT